MRKQLERQAKRLQQSKLKPGINTATLIETIHQSIIELRSLNSRKDARDLIGHDTYSLLVDNLNINVLEIMSKLTSSPVNTRISSTDSYSKSSHLQSSSVHHLNVLNSSGKNKFNSFSIENLLSDGDRRLTSSIALNKSDIMIASPSSLSSDHDDDDDDDSSNSSARSFMSCSPRPSSPELAEDPENDSDRPIDVSRSANCSSSFLRNSSPTQAITGAETTTTQQLPPPKSPPPPPPPPPTPSLSQPSATTSGVADDDQKTA